MSEVREGLVTVIVPVFNRPAGLREAVASALAQSYRPIEVVVVDDGSTDETLAAAGELATANAGMVGVVRRHNGGPGAARETGRRLAQGEFVQYLDSDDLLLPGKLERQVAGLRAAPECHVAYGMTRYRAADGSVLAERTRASARRVPTMFPSFLVSRWWETATPLYRRSIVEQAGPWTDLRLEEDWEYDCRIASLGARLHYSEDFVCEHRDHTGERLSRGNALDPRRNHDRARAHALIFQHAQRAAIPRDSPEMRHFARELFLLARQCGASGLPVESRALFALARRASTPARSRGNDFRLYRAAAALLGWVGAGRASQLLERVR